MRHGNADVLVGSLATGLFRQLTRPLPGDGRSINAIPEKHRAWPMAQRNQQTYGSAATPPVEKLVEQPATADGSTASQGMSPEKRRAVMQAALRVLARREAAKAAIDQSLASDRLQEPDPQPEP